VTLAAAKRAFKERPSSETAASLRARAAEHLCDGVIEQGTHDTIVREIVCPPELTLKVMCPVYIVMDGDVVRKVVVDDESLDLAGAEVIDPRTDDVLDAERARHAVPSPRSASRIRSRPPAPRPRDAG
jgi:hypothetical protein